MAEYDSGLAGMISAFAGPPKYTRDTYSQPLEGEITGLTNEQGAARGVYNTGLANYESALNANNPLIGKSIADWSGLAKGITGRTNDPLGDYKGLLDYVTSKINPTVLNNVAQNKFNMLRRSALARGIDINPSSSYANLLANQTSAANYLPAFQSSLVAAGQAYPQMFNQRMAQNEYNLGLTPRYIDLLKQQENRTLAPAMAKTASIRDLVGSAGNILDLFKANTRGYTRQKRPIEKVADFSNAFHNTVDDAWDKYMQLYGGGAGGGGQSKRQRSNVPDTIPYGGSNPNYDASYDRYWGSPANYGRTGQMDYPSDYGGGGGGSYFADNNASFAY